MAKAIKVLNSYNEVVAIVDNATQAIKAIEKASGCSVAEGITVRSVNRDLVEYNSANVYNVFGVLFTVKTFEATAADVKREKQFVNAQKAACLFN
jgi:hypothetical protein